MKSTIIILLITLLLTTIGCTTTPSSIGKEEVVIKDNIKYTLKIKPKRELTEGERKLVFNEFSEVVRLYKRN